MRHQGIAKLDRRTKDLVKRLTSEDVAVIDHVDMDRVSAESLLGTGVEVVINASSSISGTYPNVGPLLLTRGGVTLIDDVGQEIFECLKEGEIVEVIGDEVRRGGVRCAQGERLSVSEVEKRMEAAKAGLGDQLDKFARNTIEYLERERDILVDSTWVPAVKTEIHGRHVLVVVRGYDFREDLDALKPYIREMRPVLVGVDGGADALIEAGFKPDIIVGDMDSVSDSALAGSAELIVHAYPDGRAPGMERIERLGLAEKAYVWPLTATSEDLALLLAWESGADLIVALGTHANLVEYLDKGRKGMASTFLVRLKVGPKLVDAKGVNKLYRAAVGPSHLILLSGAALVVVTAILWISPPARLFIELVVLRARAFLGF
jgi:uncharacterized membrane-anchored protein